MRETLPLAWREVAERGVGPPTAHEAVHDGGVDDAHALDHPAHGIDQDGNVGDTFLEQIAESSGLIGK
jgi:hypothetical protein